jgi:hypothetical protein
MPMFGTLYQDDIRYFANDVGADSTGITVETFGPGHGSEYESALNTAFQFLRRHDDGRYSSRTKMRVLNAATAAENFRVAGGNGDVSGMPGVIIARKPFTYDENTEVKTGGPIGALVVWPSESPDQGRMLLAVAPHARRVKFGTLLNYIAKQMGAYSMMAWVHRDNTPGQQFLLSCGYRVERINQAGGVAYLTGNNVAVEDEGTEDGIDPLDLIDPRQQRNVNRQRERLQMRRDSMARVDPAALLRQMEDLGGTPSPPPTRDRDALSDWAIRSIDEMQRPTRGAEAVFHYVDEEGDCEPDYEDAEF